MASIFTYDPSPPRIASPWLIPAHRHDESLAVSSQQEPSTTRLEAEPQEGSIEYKLHLLLRPRRTYVSSTTVVGDSRRRKQRPANESVVSEPRLALASSNYSRQERLEQLTTQLLWRLQQSSSLHTSAPNDLVLPKLPEASDALTTPSRPVKLIAGLEESRGALYEIGVSDDGTLVGLTDDEMEESLINLRAMAASLGCSVEVIRKVVVGHCTWQELSSSLVAPAYTPESLTWGPKLSTQVAEKVKRGLRHEGPLWVAEAFVTPDLDLKRMASSVKTHSITCVEEERLCNPREVSRSPHLSHHENAEQLRVTLTGPTFSGKSSLLGVLSSSSLDNGRGRSRQNLFKHRHEIASGVTSSVAQELLGYKVAEVVNYASGDVTSWIDIQASAESRLVFVSDSAGHPRYRRTTVRGLIGWRPHWTLLCIAAGDGENSSSVSGTSSAQEVLGTAEASIDLAKAHLDLCLKLHKPLAIIITKFDLASKSCLRQTLSRILSAVKQAGRLPSIVAPEQVKGVTVPEDLKHIPLYETLNVRTALADISEDLISTVPIVMTSAVNGTGIRQVHALLQNLPVPAPPTSHDLVGLALNPEQPASLFHIEEVYGVPASYESLSNEKAQTDAGNVVAGHLRFGGLSIGDTVIVGPFPVLKENASSSNRSNPRSSPLSFGTSTFESSSTDLARTTSHSIVPASVTRGEWHNARIVSIRNLRRPVDSLEAGQVGTVGIIFDSSKESSDTSSEREQGRAPPMSRGLVVAVPSQHMIQTKHTLQAASGFTASFEDADISYVTPGALTIIYIASIRASARVIRSTPHIPNGDAFMLPEELDDPADIFRSLDSEEQEDERAVSSLDGSIDVTFELITNREWIELGSQVLCMPGGGLHGFAGKVLEVVD